MPPRTRLALFIAFAIPLGAAHAQPYTHRIDKVTVNVNDGRGSSGVHWTNIGSISGSGLGGGAGGGAAGAIEAPSEDNPDPEEENQCDNPVDIVTGMKFEDVVDFAHAALPDLRLERTYNQAWDRGRGLLGSHWITNHDLKLSTVRWPNPSNPESTPCYPIAGRAACTLAASAATLFAHRPGGGVIEFAWDASSNTWIGAKENARARIARAGSEFLLTWPDGSSERYAATGFPLQRLQADGTGLTYEYGTDNRLTRVRHTAGPSITFKWLNLSQGGHVEEVVDPAGQVYRFQAGSNLYRSYPRTLLSDVYYPSSLGNVSYHHDYDARYTGKSIAGSRFTWYAYDTNARVVESKKTDGIDLKQYAYSDAGTLRTNALGLKVDYAIEEGRIVGTTGHATPNCPTTRTQRVFDSEGRLMSETDALGRVTAYERNGDGWVTRRTEAAGTPQQRVTSYSWDAVGRPTIVTTQHHLQVESTYTPQGLLQLVDRRSLASGAEPGARQSTAYSYTRHANGMLDQVVEDGPLAGTGDATTWRYATNGNLLSIANGLGQATTFALHDGMGRPGRVTGPNGDVREVEYDARGNVVLARRVTAGGNHETRYVFDSANRLASTTDSDGTRTDFAYDAAHRLVTEVRREPAGTYAVRQLAYNAESLPTSVRTERSASHPFPVYASTFVSQSVPGGMVAGKTYPVTVRLRNTGNVPWRTSDGYRLVFTAPVAATPWTTGNTVALPGEVAPGAEVTFSFNVTAPRSTSALAVQWRMTRDGVGVFGAATPQVSVPATLVYRAELVDQVAPSSMYSNESGTVTVRVRNTGTHAWNVAGEPKVVLASDNDGYPMPSKNYATGAIQPGQIAMFSYTVGPMPHSHIPYRVGGAIWMENISFLFKLPEASFTVLTTGHCDYISGEGTSCEQPI